MATTVGAFGVGAAREAARVRVGALDASPRRRRRPAAAVV